MNSIPSGRFVVLDFETTGLSPAMGARVIEVSAREVVDGRAGHEFLTFVDPGVRVPAEITQITGITTAMLSGAPTSAVAMCQLASFIGTSPIVCHNAGFDRKFYEHERCLEVLKLKHGHPFQIARLVYERGFLSEAQVLSVFGEERIERARAEMVWREPVDVPTLSTYDFIPACAFVPHAHDSAAPECVGCHLREKCGAGQPGILERVIRQFGSDDPKQQRVRTQGALRVQRCRERKAQATRDAAA